jgi:uncharacterized protein YijF (DUF1287 family)
VPDDSSKIDKNNNGISDPIDIVNEAKKEVQGKTKYQSNYYVGGYPPNGEGVCTDVIWRGLKGANINLKDLMDKDIKNNLSLYTRVEGKADPNIDFRRVPNQKVFFDKTCDKITTDVIEKDIDNLRQWQPGDIVLWTKAYEHVGIVSDKRDWDGVPFVIHNSTPEARESKLTWFPKIENHYRWKY